MLTNTVRVVARGKKFRGVVGVASRVSRFDARQQSTSQDNILRCPYPDVNIPRITLPEFVWKNWDRWADKTATICGITGRSYTYHEIYKGSLNISKALRKKIGLKRGDTVAVILPNSPEYPLVIFGVAQAGLILTTLNPIYKPEEISRQFEDADVKAVFTSNDLYPVAEAAIKLYKRKIPIIGIKTEPNQVTPEGVIKFQELYEYSGDYDLEPNSVDDVVVLPYSSGTTGLPKGVELTQLNLVSNLSQMRDPAYILENETTDSFQEVVPAILPMFHIYGLVVNTLSILTSGCKLVTLPKFTPQTYLETLVKYKATMLFLAPPVVLFLASHPSVTPEHLKTVRTVTSAAAPLGALDAERFLAKAPKGVEIAQGYGLTETSPVVTMVPKGKSRETPYSSIGFVAPNTLGKVVDINDPTFTPLGPNQQGELLVKGPQVMKGYHNRPEETTKAFAGDWYRTGDVVYYDEKQQIYITDRLKELIKVKGFQVAPAELEEILRDHPDVEDAAVFGAPHPEQGEAPTAALVVKAGKTIDEDKIKEFVASKVAKYKQLTGGVVIVDSIPKNAAGKILRKQLKDKFLEK